MEPSSWYLGSKPLTHEQKVEKMKDMYTQCQEKDKQKRRDQIAKIKQRKADEVIDSDEEQTELSQIYSLDL